MLVDYPGEFWVITLAMPPAVALAARWVYRGFSPQSAKPLPLSVWLVLGAIAVSTILQAQRIETTRAMIESADTSIYELQNKLEDVEMAVHAADATCSSAEAETTALKAEIGEVKDAVERLERY